ncbi:hypothetical protein SAMN02745164_01009 [Marinitoga hydrogenitolerans DSM 16785]|uniref:Uncharacterized protein n=1 Tax=Marinitoga hydrogenitolerans (strain DSM 16785 / JCM 12826 / AT1271) TaxID=1122195 RepID=A0A1M4VSV1_MARH1|nr:hypothetical protein [Marinitoga hydrogenitolerans]SHE71945.1 hypothetical protein SAMN02745164_01009 [Marinitoga hydrogenitolerans DSM 16785]
MISPVSGVSSQYVPQNVSRQVNAKAVQNVQKTAQDFGNLLNAIMYKQNGLTEKMVRIVGEMYQGQKLDILA